MGSCYTGSNKKTVAEFLLLRFSVEVVGFELKMQTPPETLV